MKLPGAKVREHLGQRRLEGVGLGAVRVEVEVVAIALLACLGTHGPFVFLGNVVDDQVEDHRDPLLLKGFGQLTQVGSGAEVGPDPAIVGHGIPAVVVPVTRQQERHEVQIAHPQLGEVGGLVGDGAQTAGEPLGVAGVADHVRSLQPVRLQQSPLIQVEQVLGAVTVGGRSPRDQVSREQVLLAWVDITQAVHQVGQPAVDSTSEPSHSKYRFVHQYGVDGSGDRGGRGS